MMTEIPVTPIKNQVLQSAVAQGMEDIRQGHTRPMGDVFRDCKVALLTYNRHQSPEKYL